MTKPHVCTCDDCHDQPFADTCGFEKLMIELMTVARRWHGYDDEQHRATMPDCRDCFVIGRADRIEKEMLKS